MKKQFGLIGYPLSHSFSKKYFSDKFEQEQITDCQYDLYPLSDINELPALIAQHPNLKGLNVTIPYKEKVLDYLDALEESAHEIGAVNTIKIEDGKLTGYNTDVYGFEVSLLKCLKDDLSTQKGLILGTGGASKAVAYVFRKKGITFNYVSRLKRDNILDYQMLDKETMEKHTIIVNTTPLGMHPNPASAPQIPYKYLNRQHLLFDLVYNPEVTTFLQKGLDQKASIKNGLEMLHLQAIRSWEIWSRK